MDYFKEFAGFLCSFIRGIIATIYLVWYLYFKDEKNVGKFLLYACINLAVEAEIFRFFFSNILDLPVVGIFLIAINTLHKLDGKNTNVLYQVY